MQSKQKFTKITPIEISTLLKTHYYSLMASFYETQNLFLKEIYKRYGSIETANIMGCFKKNAHLAILRERESSLNFDLSLNKFWNNFQKISKPIEKISSIVEITNIPKETVRRKIKNLVNTGFILNDKNSKGYIWNLSQKRKDSYFENVNNEIKILTKFTYKFAKLLKLNLNLELIEKEIKIQFSFYMYHLYSCQLKWLKLWKTKLKDSELILVIIQCIIPTLQRADKNSEHLNVENIFKIIGKINEEDNSVDVSVNATSISEVTGIPRATCIRKLEKLMRLGFLLREAKTRRFYVNQNISDRTKNIVTKENIGYTVEIFSEYLAIILNNLMYQRKRYD